MSEVVTQRLHWYKEDLDYEHPTFGSCGRLASEHDANLVGSFTNKGTHMPVIDIDIPHDKIRVERSPNGNCHLYIDHEMSQWELNQLLWGLEACGLVERGYANAARAQGMSMVRKPGVPKPDRYVDTGNPRRKRGEHNYNPKDDPAPPLRF